MMAIIEWELFRRRAYLLWWCVGVVALIGVLMLVYPSIHQQATQLDQLMQSMPQSVRALRGGDSDLSSPVGYLNAEIFYITLPLLLIIMAVGLGGSLLAKDEQDHTLELLLARPVSRGRVLLAKGTSGLLMVGLVGLVAALTTIVFAKIVGMDLAAGHILLATISTTVFAASFGAITFALSAASIFSRRLGSTVALIASFGGYILQSLSSLSTYIETPAKFLPYHYFNPKDMLTGQLDRGFLVYMLGIFIAAVMVSYLGFRRRDIS